MSPESITSAPPLSGLPFVLLAALALAAVAAAVALHLVRRSDLPQVRWGFAAARLGATYLAWWLVIVVLCNLGSEKSETGRWIFATSWPLGLWSFLGALGTETIIALYRFERQSVSRAVGGALLGLRVGLLLLALFWLTQPTWHKEWDIDNQRFVVVLVDDSASMGLTDADAPAREKLDLAQLFGIEVKDRPADFRDTERKIKELKGSLSSQLQVLELMSATDSGGSRQLEDRFAKLKELTITAKELLAGVSKTLDRPGGDKLKLDNSATTLLTSLQGQIKTLMDGPLGRLEKLSVAGGHTQLAGISSTREDVRQAIDGLGRIHEGMARLPFELDEAYWRSLPAPKREEIQRHTTVARAAIARQVLLRKDKGADDKSLAEKLSDGYALKFYHFASRGGAVPPETYVPEKKDLNKKDKDQSEGAKAAGADSNAKPAPSKAATAGPAPPALDDNSPEATAWRSATDLAAALKLSLDDIPQDRLSGVVLLWDGRHNAIDPVETMTAALKARRAPVVSVLIGSRHVRKDAAVKEFDVPQTIMAGDKISIKAEVNLDGYRGEDVVVRLMRGKDEVNRQTVKVPEDRHHAPLVFSDTAKQVGTFPYRIEILSAGGTPLTETVMVNNTAERVVSVTDDRIKVLIVEGRVRWDFRYLKNMFSGPDKNVHLQYILTNPSRLADAPTAPPVHVSASRPMGQFEGTLLPENEKEWMKFDVIILGDVSPSTLTKETIELLNKFVFQRGGTLIVLAGADYMPHAYADTKLAEMLPMRCDKVEGSLRQGPEPGFRIFLTDEGKQHVVMRQLSGSDSEKYWQDLPVMRWRHPKTRAKEGAVRLAYARSAYPDGTRAAADQERIERDNCLICLNSYGAGKVMMLSFDESFRLRYRVEPVYHHRLWGQAVRWGADEKLQAGTAQVRLGSDRPRYDVGQPVTIKARLLNEKGDPVTEGEVEAKVYRGDKLLHTVRLNAKPGMPGRFEGQIGSQLEPSVYRVELGGATVGGLLTSGDVKKVETEIAVSASKSTSELVELTADAKVPLDLAEATQGRVLAPIEAASIFDVLGQKSSKSKRPEDFVLWDTLPVLLLFLAIGSVEWILRKKAGLT